MPKEKTRLERLEAAAEEKIRRKGPLCLVCGAEEDIRTFILRRRAKNPPQSYSVISDLLADEGVVIATETIGRHFRAGHEQRRKA